MIMYRLKHNVLIPLLLMTLAGVARAQNPTSVMRIHCNDGAVAEMPVALVDSITFDYSTGNNIAPSVSDSITSNEVFERA